MTDIITQHAVYKEAARLATDIFDEASRTDHTDVDDLAEKAMENIHEWIDGHEWVIYYYKAHQLCAAVDTSHGEMMIEDIGAVPKSYDEYATHIAYWTLDQLIREAMNNLVDLAKDAEFLEAM